MEPNSHRLGAPACTHDAFRASSPHFGAHLYPVADRRGSPVLRPQSSVQPDRQTTEDCCWPWIWSAVIVVSGFGIATAVLVAALAWRI